MSDLIPTQHESAVVVLRERACELAGEIQIDARALELKTARHEELLDVIATLSRKPRVRAPRAVKPAANDTDDTQRLSPDPQRLSPVDIAEETSPRPTMPPLGVFATPSLEEAVAA